MVRRDRKVIVFNHILLEQEETMATRKNTVCAASETKWKDKDVALQVGTNTVRLSVGDIILHDRSSEEDRAVMKTYLMKHPKAAVVDMFLSLLLKLKE